MKEQTQGIPWSSGPQSLCHQSLVSQKTIFPLTGVEWGQGWFGVIKAHYNYCALNFYYFHISPTSGHQALDPRRWGPLPQRMSEPRFKPRPCGCEVHILLETETTLTYSLPLLLLSAGCSREREQFFPCQRSLFLAEGWIPALFIPLSRSRSPKLFLSSPPSTAI